MRAAHERLSVRADALQARRAELAEELERRQRALGALAGEVPTQAEGTEGDPVGAALKRIASAPSTRRAKRSKRPKTTRA